MWLVNWQHVAAYFQWLFILLHAGRLDEAERRFRRVADMLGDRVFFHNLPQQRGDRPGLVALARWAIPSKRVVCWRRCRPTAPTFIPTPMFRRCSGWLADVGQNAATRDRFLRKALRFAGQRSLLEEYMSVLVEVTRMDATTAPVKT